jgi:hypothetical protein
MISDYFAKPKWVREQKAWSICRSSVNLQYVISGHMHYYYHYYYYTQVAGACEYGNELSGSIKCGEFLD